MECLLSGASFCDTLNNLSLVTTHRSIVNNDVITNNIIRIEELFGNLRTLLISRQLILQLGLLTAMLYATHNSTWFSVFAPFRTTHLRAMKHIYVIYINLLQHIQILFQCLKQEHLIKFGFFLGTTEFLYQNAQCKYEKSCYRTTTDNNEVYWAF